MRRMKQVYIPQFMNRGYNRKQMSKHQMNEYMRAYVRTSIFADRRLANIEGHNNLIDATVWMQIYRNKSGENSLTWRSS
jgi:hypothetical protein